MHELYELKEQLLDELKEYRSKQKKTMDDLMVIKYLTSSIDHLCNIIMNAEEEEYSGRGSYNMGGGNYSRENRYSREGRGGNRYSYEGGQGGGQGGGQSGGSYARGRGRNARRDSMGRYSGEDGYSRTEGVEGLAEDIRGMMQDLPPNVQQDAQRFIQKLEQQM